MATFTSTISGSLKETLDVVVTDEEDREDVCSKYCDIRMMTDAWHDDLEVGGPGLASEKPEGAKMKVGDIKEGATKRYQAVTYALMMDISEEAIEDNKYDRVIQAGKRLGRAMLKTKEYSAVQLLARAENSAYTGVYGQPLASTTHGLPHGGTWSNTTATPMSPSTQSLEIHRAAVMQYPGHDGLIEGYEIKKVVFPVQQWGVWKRLLGSSMDPQAGNFSAINIAKDLDITPVPNKYWTNTTTNYCYITDADYGLSFLWRVKPETRSWVENAQTIMKYGRRARWDEGWTDPRGVYFVGA